MDLAEYRQMADFEDSYWWHVGRNEVIARQLDAVGIRSADILNIGCGTGGTVPVLEPHGTVTNIDTSERALEICAERGIDHLVHFDGGPLPFEDGSFDVGVALDVLEHIEDDAAALDDWKRVLRPGGTLVLTVPAHQWLWSDHDVRLHHFRRYTRPQVRRRITDAGFVVTKSSYAIAFSFPMVVAYRILSKLRPKAGEAETYVSTPAPLNRLFTALLGLEARLLRRADLPIGTSVLVIAHKPR